MFLPLRLLTIFGLGALVRAENDRPIVGILTQPLGTEQNSSKSSTTMIAASYVKFLESAGARVVPVHYDSSAAELTALSAGDGLRAIGPQIAGAPAAAPHLGEHTQSQRI